ncbi:hypothetical protein TVD_09130 [Thioalkalivibrio versutus]|uniref:Uncharacterized protein n=1 Tax=Thioalkalivibrio versutus TaxID=106634 RepID=A0A0G3G2N2_9GAMM|nr:hypothetical protein [Thioalkalivibrio versutus]AKJ95508.1 hypothetical protein TVD_09130 [Thioalkalivibrio versutus]
MDSGVRMLEVVQALFTNRDLNDLLGYGIGLLALAILALVAYHHWSLARYSRFKVDRQKFCEFKRALDASADQYADIGIEVYFRALFGFRLSAICILSLVSSGNPLKKIVLFKKGRRYLEYNHKTGYFISKIDLRWLRFLDALYAVLAFCCLLISCVSIIALLEVAREGYGDDVIGLIFSVFVLFLVLSIVFVEALWSTSASRALLEDQARTGSAFGMTGSDLGNLRKNSGKPV